MPKRPKIITVTGGKGGTGKTLCAVNIATMFKNESKKVLLIDGDVENPNTYLLLGGTLNNKSLVNYFKPQIVEDKCTKCGICAENCASHALLYLDGAVPIPMLTVCSGCKLCYKICPSGAIQPDSKIIGWKYRSEVNSISLLIGELKPSEARSAAIVEDLLKDVMTIIEQKPNEFDIIILDTAPGAHCDVELLINMADLVIPVTEPTKFGEMDLLRIIELITLLNKEYKVIVNRSSLLGFRDEFLENLSNKNIKILGDIPLDDDVVHSYCQGTPLMDVEANYSKDGGAYASFLKIYDKLKEWIHEKDNR
ncbi:MAG: P-loop NTPase [Candidatus Lokiarchaeota archaeon]|nr:P-loop NTPase [Candidatus Lokiarchaeota archaeon]